MARGLILFVHGLGGDARHTWGRFANLVAADPTFAEYDVDFFEYPTSLLRLPLSKKRPSIQTLGEALGTILDVRYPDHDPIILVAHSLGGLICRQYLVDRVMAEEPLRTRKLLLYAVPNDGAGLANVGRYVSFRHRQIKQLTRNSDVITDLNRAWSLLNMGDKLEIWSVVAGIDHVVDEASAKALPGNNKVRVLANCGHRDCVKPRSASDDSYQIASRFVSKPLEIAAAVRPPRRRAAGDYKVVAFDLDGTLIRGLTFSWTRVWDHLGYEREVRKTGMRNYLTGAFTYEEWCEWAVHLFRDRNLNRSQFPAIAQGLTLTKNFEPAIRVLRDHGYAIGILSGGIDTLMTTMIPNVDELFDHVYINRLRFDEDGKVCGVVPTRYDFADKLKGLQKMAEAYGASMDETVFVGEGFNDAAVTAAAGLGIAYPPHDYGTEAASDVQIEEDDLMKVVEAILTH